MRLYAFLIGFCLRFHAAQACSSQTFDFVNHFNPEELDLSTPPDTVIASFLVENVNAVFLVPAPVYIGARLVGSQLTFFTTANFSQYEEHEVQLVIILQVTYTCATGQKNGIYRQNIKEANNHAPRFLEEAYRALVPLPLPKYFDVSPYLANGAGVMARDIDLVNNTVQFSLSNNDYFTIESHPVTGDVKQFKAILRLREQVLKLANTVELIVTATDRGVPPKASQAIVTIEPDLSIVYDDPPEFKDIFINGTLEKDAVIQLELIPGTETQDVQYTLEGSDSRYFSLSVWANNSGLDLKLVNLDELPPAKFFLNVLAVAKRTELQKTSAIILLAIPPESRPETAETTVEKVLVVFHLEEMAEHRNVYPMTIGNCVFSIDSQTPGEYFYVDEASGTLSSKPFDREDSEVFGGLDFPQFWIVLKLNCPILQHPQSDTLNVDLTRLGPMRDIAYSTKLTHLNIIVQDINDNSPEFVYPANNALLAFPSARLAQKLLPEQLIKVEASDRDEGINAIIRYRLAMNDHFGIEATTGVIFPLKNALAKESSITLEVYATDRDGAEDGNTSTLKIKVLRGTEDQFVVVAVQNIDPVSFEKLLKENCENVLLAAIRNVYTVVEDRNTLSSRVATERYATQAVVYAMQDETLLSSTEVAGILKSLQPNMSMAVSTINELYTSQPTIGDSDTTIVYPYIVAAFFGTLAIGMGAAAIYFRAKSRQHHQPGGMFFTSETASVNSAATIVGKEHNDPSSTPPLESPEVQNMNDVTVSDSIGYSEVPRAGPYSLTELLSIDESLEHEDCATDPPQSTQKEQKKSIKFSDHVERIEVFDKNTDN
uniref:Cadherin domain-containing protein n=1 Tax=Anopheles atroparvus TaxID=41427 RepID=A0AAG5D5Z1_ANOAO